MKVLKQCALSIGHTQSLQLHPASKQKTRLRFRSIPYFICPPPPGSVSRPGETHTPGGSVFECPRADCLPARGFFLSSPRVPRFSKPGLVLQAAADLRRTHPRHAILGHSTTPGRPALRAQLGLFHRQIPQAISAPRAPIRPLGVRPQQRVIRPPTAPRQHPAQQHARHHHARAIHTRPHPVSPAKTPPAQRHRRGPLPRLRVARQLAPDRRQHAGIPHMSLAIDPPQPIPAIHRDVEHPARVFPLHRHEHRHPARILATIADPVSVGPRRPMVRLVIWRDPIPPPIHTLPAQHRRKLRPHPDACDRQNARPKTRHQKQPSRPPKLRGLPAQKTARRRKTQSTEARTRPPRRAQPGGGSPRVGTIHDFTKSSNQTGARQRHAARCGLHTDGRSRRLIAPAAPCPPDQTPG